MTEIDKYKHDLAKKVQPVIDTEGLTDLTAWILENSETKYKDDRTHSGLVRSVAYILERTGKYEVIPVEDWKRFYVKKLPNIFKRTARIALVNQSIGLAFGIALGLLIDRCTHRQSKPNNSQKIETIQNQYIYTPSQKDSQ